MLAEQVVTIQIGRQGLQLELWYLVASVVFISAGVNAMVLSWLRSRDRLLLWLGVLSLLYGLRIPTGNRIVLAAFGASPSVGRDVEWIITCVILIPATLFFKELFAPDWRRIFAAWLWVQIVFAPIGIILGFLGYRDPLWTINNLLALVGAVFAMSSLFLRRKVRHIGVLRWCMGLFFVLVIANNLELRPGGYNIEPIGFAALIAGLGYTAAKRASEREQKLIEVEYELEMARRIQRSILPRQLPNVAGLRLAARYEPMTAVAGDFYDFHSPGDRQITFLVADVSGHGVPAALIASMLKVAFTAQADHARDPATLLANLNATLAGQLDGQFVTAACAYIDLAAGSITYAGAGHPPALLVRGNGEVVELAENGLMLGPFRQARYSNITDTFRSGDKLILYTDGIIEATLDNGDQFGMDRLKEHARSGSSDLVAFADRLIAAVSRPIREDDLTVVVAQSD